jgi:3-oxoacyl-[acyl-carrier-protein] synthase-3
MRIIDLAVSKLGVPRGKMLTNIERVGNTSSASIPILLDESVRSGKVRPGDTVLMCALGAGISWGSAVVRV